MLSELAGAIGLAGGAGLPRYTDKILSFFVPTEDM
jgi:hypothetical protein